MTDSRLTVLLLALVTAASCGKGKAPPPAPAVPVEVAEASLADVPITVEAPGTIEAYNSVSIIARVAGQVRDIHFSEGEDVTVGQMLMTIDPAPFEERVRQAEAQLARDKATYAFRRAEADRYKFLVDKGAVSKSEYEKVLADATAIDETVKSDQAALESARLDLSYCSIRSPVDGRAGVYVVNAGGVVEQNKTVLVVINQVKPIRVKFSLPERHLADVKRALRTGTPSVTVCPPATRDDCRSGRLTFIDNTVDTKTGMIQLKAEFPNQDSALWPGQFVETILSLGMQKDAVVIPTRAVQAGVKGDVVFVVKPDNTVDARMVTVERKLGESAVIADGIAVGERVVVSGQNKLRSGAAVAPAKPAEAGAPAK